MNNKINQIFCPLCKNKNVYQYATKDNYVFWRGKDCGLIFLYPLPDTHQSNVYNEDYFSGAKEGFGYVNYDQDKSAMAPLFRQFLQSITKHSPNRGRLLDVGAATGYFVELANQANYTAQGIDISNYAVLKAQEKGLKVNQATLDSFKTIPNSFDTITMWDVLEHLPNPKQAILKIYNLLKPQGLLAINTPDGGSLWAKILKGKWQALVPPEHMIIFNKKALTTLLTNTGFEIIEIKNPIKKFTPGYVLKVFSHTMKITILSKFIEILNKKPFNKLAIPIPTYDNLFILARKKD